MAKNIFVGNLVWDATHVDLLELFSPYGKVTRAQVITDHETGRPRGFGFVEMENDAEAEQAIAALHNADHKGRPLTVHEARDSRLRQDAGAPERIFQSRARSKRRTANDPIADSAGRALRAERQ